MCARSNRKSYLPQTPRPGPIFSTTNAGPAPGLRVQQRGAFAVIEGVDGSGKSTLWTRLGERLTGAQNEAWFHERFTGLALLREPTDLPPGRRIRERLAARAELPREEWLAMFLEDRAANVGERIQPALARGELVLQDRYYYSTAAYQGDLESGPSPVEIVGANQARGFPAPDLLFFLDIEPEAAWERIASRGADRESFETLAQLTRIRKNYLSCLPASALRLAAANTPADLEAAAMTALRRFTRQS
jgi:dTMP kinase